MRPPGDEAQQPTQAFAALDRTAVVGGGRRFDQPVANPLVVVLGVGVVDGLRHDAPAMLFAQRDHAVEALAADGADEALGVRVQVGASRTSPRPASSRISATTPAASERWWPTAASSLMSR